MRHYLCAACVGRLTRGEDPPIAVWPCCILAENVGRAGRRGGHRRPRRCAFDGRPHVLFTTLGLSRHGDRRLARPLCHQKTRFGFPLMGLLAQRNVLSSKAARSSTASRATTRALLTATHRCNRRRFNSRLFDEVMLPQTAPAGWGSSSSPLTDTAATAALPARLSDRRRVSRAAVDAPCASGHGFQRAARFARGRAHARRLLTQRHRCSPPLTDTAALAALPARQSGRRRVVRAVFNVPCASGHGRSTCRAFRARSTNVPRSRARSSNVPRSRARSTQARRPRARRQRAARSAARPSSHGACAPRARSSSHDTCAPRARSCLTRRASSCWRTHTRPPRPRRPRRHRTASRAAGQTTCPQVFAPARRYLQLAPKQRPAPRGGHGRVS